MKYEIGDKVVINLDLSLCDGDEVDVGISEDMLDYRGKIVTIKDKYKYCDNCYRIEEDDARWLWDESYIAGKLEDLIIRGTKVLFKPLNEGEEIDGFYIYFLMEQHGGRVCTISESDFDGKSFQIEDGDGFYYPIGCIERFVEVDIDDDDEEEEIVEEKEEDEKKMNLTFDKLTEILIVNDTTVVVHYEDTSITFKNLNRFGGTDFTTYPFYKLKDKKVSLIKPIGDVIEITLE